MFNSPRTISFGSLNAILIFSFLLAGCSQPTSTPAPPKPTQKVTVDLSTPESTMLSIEEAYRSNDYEAALKCKDFEVEARLMMDKLDFNDEMKNNEEILTQLKDTLELAFRAEYEKNGFPDFNGASSTFSDKAPYQGKDDVIQMKETVKFPNGKSVASTVHVAKTDDGWKFIMIPDAN
ncbi:MAG: hypothetical protein AAF497_06550 [Planctomycetota bacterium]